MNIIDSAIENIKSSFGEGEHLSFIDAEKMRTACEVAVLRFYETGKADKFAETGMESRMEIANNFYESIKYEMGVTAKLKFKPMESTTCGSYNAGTNTIEINSSMYLNNPNCSGLLNTILHETRHAFQHRAVNNPDSVSIDNTTINTWRDNFAHYIPPSFDLEAYRRQPVEDDAFSYANNIIIEGDPAKTNTINFNQPLDYTT